MFPLHRDLSSYSEPRKCACPKFSKLLCTSCIPCCPAALEPTAAKRPACHQSSLSSRVTEEWQGASKGKSQRPSPLVRANRCTSPRILRFSVE